MTLNATIKATVILDSIQLLIDEKQFEAALDRATLISRPILRDSTATDISRFYFLKAWCLFKIGQYHKSLSTIRSGLKFAAPTNAHELFAREKQLYALVLTRIGRSHEALEAFLEAFVGFKRAGRNEMLYGSLVNLGLCYFVKGELSRADETFRDALESAKKFNDATALALCKRNLARVQVLAGSFDSAESLICDQVPSDKNMTLFGANSLCIRSQISALNLHYKRAKEDATDSLQVFLHSASFRDVAVCLEYLGLNEYFAGNYAKAREYYDQVLAMPEPTASAVAQTLRMLTDVEIAEHHWDAARETAAKAEVAITRISERIELGALWRAYGHVHTHDGNHAAAREYFEKSIDLLRQLGARYELALSHFDAGRSACYSAEQRLEQLRQAKALFIDMDVPKRVAQVDHALSLLAVSISARSCSVDGQKSLTLKTAKPAPVIVARSRAMLEIVATADRFKDGEMTVLITGETGTGKDLLAEYIHYSSHRAHRPYKAINCAAIPESLLESELFGFKKGTYTGAGADKPGLIESADGGSFFFDEIGDAPLAIQAKLLRVIETKTVRRLGDNQDISVDVRFIAATNQDLKSQIEAKTFRSDLFYRLAQVNINLPPLRERREDIIPLLETFLAAAGVALTAEDRSRLLAHPNGYSWPGNVRELIAIAARVAALQDDNGNRNIVNLLLLELGIESPEAEERQRLFTALQRHNGNKSKAADELGIPRTTLVSQLKKFNL